MDLTGYRQSETIEPTTLCVDFIGSVVSVRSVVDLFFAAHEGVEGLCCRGAEAQRDPWPQPKIHFS